jgi:hypothetical protein
VGGGEVVCYFRLILTETEICPKTLLTFDTKFHENPFSSFDLFIANDRRTDGGANLIGAPQVAGYGSISDAAPCRPHYYYLLLLLVVVVVVVFSIFWQILVKTDTENYH